MMRNENPLTPGPIKQLAWISVPFKNAHSPCRRLGGRAVGAGAGRHPHRPGGLILSPHRLDFGPDRFREINPVEARDLLQAGGRSDVDFGEIAADDVDAGKQ
jgi:hypothetical protein